MGHLDIQSKPHITVLPGSLIFTRIGFLFEDFVLFLCRNVQSYLPCLRVVCNPILMLVFSHKEATYPIRVTWVYAYVIFSKYSMVTIIWLTLMEFQNKWRNLIGEITLFRETTVVSLY
jgi:hypothetical protein